MLFEAANVRVLCATNLYDFECLVLWPCWFCANVNISFSEDGNKPWMNVSTHLLTYNLYKSSNFRKRRRLNIGDVCAL